MVFVHTKKLFSTDKKVSSVIENIVSNGFDKFSIYMVIYNTSKLYQFHIINVSSYSFINISFCIVITHPVLSHVFSSAGMVETVANLVYVAAIESTQLELTGQMTEMNWTQAMIFGNI